MLLPEISSRLTLVILALSIMLPGLLMVHASPLQVMIRPCRCGMLLQVVFSLLIATILIKYGLWPGLLMAYTLPLPALIRRCRYGMLLPETISGPIVIGRVLQFEPLPGRLTGRVLPLEAIA